MNENQSNLCRLEQILFSAAQDEFPKPLINDADKTKTYPERYDLLKTHLSEKHDVVDISALLASAKKGVLYESLVCLNQHGKGHIEAVMNRASEIIELFHVARLSAFELFLLLCAIQIHDIGNFYGREGHTVSFKNEFFSLAPACFIKEPGLKEMIFSIACVHGGMINNNKDTISQLRRKTELLGCAIRPQLLAAILRFSDELADDFTRAKKLNEIPEESKIFHAYSSTLHTSSVVQIENETTYRILLHYSLSKEDAAKHYILLGKKKSLIEEILDRTEKVERERRYCMRFIMPHILVTETKVEIDVQFPEEISLHPYDYILSESGYPDTKISIPKQEEIIGDILG